MKNIDMVLLVKKIHIKFYKNTNMVLEVNKYK